MANVKKNINEQQRKIIQSTWSVCPKFADCKLDRELIDAKKNYCIEKWVRKKTMGQEIKELSFDELLTMSMMVEDRIREERIRRGKMRPIMSKTKSEQTDLLNKYAEKVIQLYSVPATKEIAIDMRDWLSETLVKQNKKMANSQRGSILYHSLMSED